mgnify:CR=1 FL=1
MKKFRSTRRALKRGHLQVRFREEPGPFETSHVTGQITQKMIKIPYLVRKTNAGGFAFYKS